MKSEKQIIRKANRVQKNSSQKIQWCLAYK